MGVNRIVETVKGRVQRTFYNANTDTVGDSLKEVYNGEQFDRKSLVWYFSLGYVPGDLTLFQNIFCLPGGAKCEIGNGNYKVIDRFYYEDLVTPGKFDGADEPEILKIAHTTIVEVVQELYSKNKDVVLALTGGLDSRLLLGALLEVTEARNLQSFSWGKKGTYDYEIGKLLSKKFGLKHKAYDLRSIPFGIDQLTKFADLSDANTNLFEQPPIEYLIRDFENRNLWLGVVGGAASGSNLPISLLENPESYFLKSENKRTGTLASTAESLLGESIHPSDVRELTKGYKTHDFDSIDIYNHHERLIGHTVFSRKFNYTVPFSADPWLSFCLSLSAKHRNRNRTMLVDLLSTYYKRLSKVSSGNRKGNPLVQSKVSRLFNAGIGRVLGNRSVVAKRRKFLTVADFDMEISSVLSMGSSSLDIFADSLDVSTFRKQYELLSKEFETEIYDHVKTLELIFSLIIIQKYYKSNEVYFDL